MNGIDRLPPESFRFTGRLRDLADLGERIDGRARLVVVSGRAGIGKSALAVRLLRTLAARFPGGLLHADLRGHTVHDPAPPGEILGVLLRAVGAHAVPADRCEQAALWRSMTAGHPPFALLLENATTAAQVRPLLPGGDRHLTLVTSRDSLSGLAADGAAFHRLGVLPEPDARALLVRGIGAAREARDPVGVRALVAACAGLPLAVVLAAAHLAAHPGASPAETAGVLASRRDPLTAAIRHAFAALPPGAARLLRLLSTLPPPAVDTRTAAAVAALPLPVVDDLLHLLSERGLLERHGLDGYRPHDLVRHYARSRATEQEAEDALRRACHESLEAATAARRRLESRTRCPSAQPPPALPLPFDPGSDAAALAWLDGRRRHLMVLVRTAADHGLHGVVWRLVDAMRPLFTRLRVHDLAVEAYETGLLSAHRAGDPDGQRRMLRSGARALVAAGRADEASVWYTRALEAARAAGDTRGEAEALLGLGTSHQRARRWPDAVIHLSHAYRLWESVGDTRGTALVTLAMGETTFTLGEPKQALDLLTAAHRTLSAAGDPDAATRALAWRGRVLAEVGDPVRAAVVLARAEQEYERRGDVHGQAGVWEMLGDTAAAHPADARRFYERALHVYERSDPGEAGRLRERVRALPPG